MDNCSYCSKSLAYDLSVNEQGLCEACANDPEVLEDIQQQDEERKSFNSYYNNYIHEYED